MKLDDDDLMAICLGEIANSQDDGDLASEREDALKRYLGEPYGDEIEGRSSVRTRETMETVEGLMPSLMRIFAEEENLVLFQPTGPEDEEQAEQETDVCNHAFWHENRGFYNLYTFCKDALLSKTGILKVWADNYARVEREEYKGLDDLQLGQLMSEEGVEREVEEYELTEEGHHVVFKTNWKESKICIEPFPPEDFGVSRTARSPYVCDATFSWARHRKTVGELLLEGYKEDFIETLPAQDSVESAESLARRHLSDETDYTESDRRLRQIWVTECYVRIDRDDDGIPELLKVTLAAGSDSESGGTLMSVEEIDSVPLFATPAVLLTHKFYGLSIADLVMDLQQIQTVLMRQVLDNTYLANNGMTVINTDYANIDDIMTRRPGGVVRTTGEQPAGATVAPLQHAQLPPQTFEVFERLDERQRRRTGYGDEVGGLDMSALSQLNTGVAAMYFDVARMKVEMIARIIAEIGLKPLFHHIHELMIKNSFRAKAMRLRGKWVQVNPSAWKQRYDSDVSVGIGRVSRERRIMGHEAILAKQQEIIAAGGMGTLLMPWHQYEANKGWIKAWGFEPSLYFQDPRQLPPPPPKGPDPQAKALEAQSQAMLMDGQSKLMRARNEKAKIALEAQRQQTETQYKQAEMWMRGQMEEFKRQAAQLKADMEASGKLIDMGQERERQSVENALQVMQMRLEQLGKDKDRDLEYFKALLSAKPDQDALATDDEKAARKEKEVTAKQAADAQKQMEQQMAGQRDAAIYSAMQAIMQRLEDRDGPQDVAYDDKGLIARIGKKPVTRDQSGRVVRIG